MHINRTVSILTTLLFLISCEKEATNVKYPAFNQKLTISGYISPSVKNQYITVTSNTRIYGEQVDFEDPGNLSATISDGIETYTLERASVEISDPNYYRASGFVLKSSDFPVREGKTYYLKVESDKGLSAEASCTVPVIRNLKLEIDTIRIHEVFPDWIMDYLTADFYMTDIAEEVNYYRFYAIQTGYYQGYSFPEITNFTSYDNVYFNDTDINGKRYKIITTTLTSTTGCDSSFLKVYLMNTDKDYYNFNKSVQTYSSGENPFTESSPVYSNVTGGLGIFASYTMDSLILRLK